MRLTLIKWGVMLVQWGNLKGITGAINCIEHPTYANSDGRIAVLGKDEQMEVQAVEVTELVRMVLILVHVLTVAAAAVGIAFGDYAIFARPRIDADLLHKAGTAVAVTLLLLWLTGLAVIWIDTGFEWAVLMAKPKLLAKMTVVMLLTANGGALHQFVFKRLCSRQSASRLSARLPAILGAISVVTWLYAAFLGLAKPIAPLLGYSGFIGLYIAALVAGIAVALYLIEPRLAARLTLSPAPESPDKPGAPGMTALLT